MRPIFAYKVFEIEEEYESELNPVFKCPCGHLFSIGVDAETIRRGMQLNEAIAHAA